MKKWYVWLPVLALCISALCFNLAGAAFASSEIEPRSEAIPLDQLGVAVDQQVDPALISIEATDFGAAFLDGGRQGFGLCGVCDTAAGHYC